MDFGFAGWIIIGLLCGWGMARFTGRTTGQSYFFNCLIGVLGAIAGGMTTNLVTRHPFFQLNGQNIFVGVLGALVFLAVYNFVRR